MKPTIAKSAAPPYEEWLDYLSRLPDRKIADVILQFWNEAVEVCKPKTLMAPGAMPLDYPKNNWELAWDNEEHHLDIDIDYDGRLDWFYRNRKTDDLATADAIGITDLLAEKLRLIAQ